MFQCHNCASSQSHENTVQEIFWIEGRPILVKNIPAQLCVRCGEPVFSRETTEKICQLVHGYAQPTKSVAMDVFEFAS
jgi:HTH-type transcriptional regulator / antitoxin MqsA